MSKASEKAPWEDVPNASDEAVAKQSEECQKLVDTLPAKIAEMQAQLNEAQKFLARHIAPERQASLAEANAQFQAGVKRDLGITEKKGKAKKS